ncbi:MAG: hypothetical protein NZM33_16995, partial [Bryobacteraceae bacterium]|nr:hypothetical protein [Bryobacteraceae bacterium]
MKRRRSSLACLAASGGGFLPSNADAKACGRAEQTLRRSTRVHRLARAAVVAAAVLGSPTAQG